MTIKPIIGITSGEIVNKDESWSPVTYGQSRTYIDAVVNNGGIPIILPIVDDKSVTKSLYDMCDGILVSGGNDPDPKIYGEDPLPLVVNFSRRRDEHELKLISWALVDNKPILGICRGMQLINIHLGGDLFQDIQSQIGGSIDHRASSEQKTLTDLGHTLKIKPDSKFAKIAGKNKIGANAHHHQAIRNLGEGLVATAWAEDGIIEAIEIPDKTFVIAVQPHPESLENSVEPRWAKLFSAFVEASRPAN